MVCCLSSVKFITSIISFLTTIEEVERANFEFRMSQLANFRLTIGGGGGGGLTFFTVVAATDDVAAFKSTLILLPFDVILSDFFAC